MKKAEKPVGGARMSNVKTKQKEMLEVIRPGEVEEELVC